METEGNAAIMGAITARATMISLTLARLSSLYPLNVIHSPWTLREFVAGYQWTDDVADDEGQLSYLAVVRLIPT
eukprot:9368321-Pyramimonas_sp.AAC.1